MDGVIPLAQIIHISDLHVCQDYDDRRMIAREARLGRLALARLRGLGRDLIERFDVGGWHEGTLDHDAGAEGAFGSFLDDLETVYPAWFTEAKGAGLPSTWLVDTGDLTTFGDAGSLRAGHAKLEDWEHRVKGCRLRSLFGNHDAWPGTQPAIFAFEGAAGRIDEQRRRVGGWQKWRSEDWRAPLVSPEVADPWRAGQRIRVELYAINSVLFDWSSNLRAVGEVDEGEYAALLGAIRERQKTGTARALRLLALHHPVAFPFELKHARVAQLAYLARQMCLLGADAFLERLRNEGGADAVAGTTPYVHILLGGHTHAGFPGARLPDTAKEAYQGRLGPKQLQLTAGPLMLIRDKKKVARAIGDQPELRKRKDFSQPWIFPHSRQFQRLALSLDPAFPEALRMTREVFAYQPAAGGFKSIPELESTTTMPL